MGACVHMCVVCAHVVYGDISGRQKANIPT